MQNDFKMFDETQNIYIRWNKKPVVYTGVKEFV